MTLGAKQRDIIFIFLIQGLILGLIGIILGVFLGILLSNNIDTIISFIENLFGINLMPAEIYHLSKIPSIIDYNNIFFIVIYTFIPYINFCNLSGLKSIFHQSLQVYSGVIIKMLICKNISKSFGSANSNG